MNLVGAIANPQQADDALQEVAEIARKNAILLLCSEMNPPH
jgi:O-acetylhomoserine/O-acetylserine sulfhydrylase-like pyridoxal-dependent enzyme